MEFTENRAISAIDGRYKQQTHELQHIFSEYGLMHSRLKVEIKWLQALANNSKIKELPKFSSQQLKYLDNILATFSDSDAIRIKTIEQETNHDVKAIEYFLKEKLSSYEEVSEFIHFCCTSEDINNLAYGIMLKTACNQYIIPQMKLIISTLTNMAHNYAHQPMLARTHGQPASPTTMGKELANFVSRLKRQLENFKATPITGKINGAVGNYNAHIASYPKIDWEKLSQTFVESLDLQWNQYTTQIEPHDTFAELCNYLTLFNTILIDLCRDMWGYISLGYFTQNIKKKEVGSSVMPHKVNPINFENAEGNLGIANALFSHFASKLPISRWQRDLSDSTVLRNIGTAFAHALLAFKSVIKGLNKLAINPELLEDDLNQNWQVLAEAIQTVMRRYGIKNSYEKLKSFTRGKKTTKQELHNFIATIDIPLEAKKELTLLTPLSYIGKAESLAKKI